MVLPKNLKWLDPAAGFAVIVATAMLYVLVYLTVQGDSTFTVQVQDFLTVTVSILVEALPFVVLGVLFSVIINHYISAERLLKILPKRAVFRRLALSVSGTLMPVCECGNVPVARSLMRKGLSVADSVTFLLAAPIINPITIMTTVIAFSFDPAIPVVRVLAALVIANLIGMFIARRKNAEKFLNTSFADECRLHHHQDRKVSSAVRTFIMEFSLLARWLALGALIAAGIQAFLPTGILQAVGSDPVISVFAMMALAFVISICASVDAFFALAYATTFTSGSLLAFMIFGPMMDIKMLALLQTTFSKRFLFWLILALTFFSGLVGIGFNLVTG